MNGAKGHVLITGAAIRIGRVIAVTLAEAGWDITIHYNTSRTEAVSLAEEIRHLGRQATLVQANLENTAELEKVIPQNPGYPLTALVNNASLFEHDTKDPDGSRHNAVNCNAPLMLTERLAAQLPQGAKGAVVHMLDATPIPTIMSGYAASRKNLEDKWPAQAKALASRLRVNALSLGPTLINPRQSQSHFDRIATNTPRGHAYSPEEAAKAVRALLENPTLVGQTLDIDTCIQSF